jgi:hypothetical protein
MGTQVMDMIRDSERLVAIMEVFEAKMKAKIDAWLEEMKVCRKETTACQEAAETSLEKTKANANKSKAVIF